MGAAFSGIVKFRAPAQKAAITPPIGPLLGQCGLKAMDYVKRFNEETKKYHPGTPLNVILDVRADKSYSQMIKTPATSWFLKRAVGIARANPDLDGRRKFNGSVSMRQIYEIAKIKSNDPHLGHLSLHAICGQILSIARHLKLRVVE